MVNSVNIVFGYRGKVKREYRKSINWKDDWEYSKFDEWDQATDSGNNRNQVA